MCFDHDSRPPIPVIAGASVDGGRVALVAADGTRVLAYEADAAAPTGLGMLVLPDVRGLHRYYEELALRFAEAGIDAVAVDHFGRTAPSDDRGEGFAYMPHVEAATWDGLRADVAAGAARLRSRRGVARLACVGFCFGGRLSFDLAAVPGLALDGVIGFYGNPVGPGRAGMPAPIDTVGDVRCPVLGLFAGDDPGIPAASIAAYDAALGAAGVDRRIVTYPGAPHSFFDRKQAEFAAESAAAWDEVLAFTRRVGSA
jgi:carboxymethylenebutenolidase